jgi:FtsP/CotA-like multicopper oxidase with cupredoxin domain
LVLFDARLDDGVTTHKDMHDGMGEFPAAKNPATHPKWWGKTFYKHFPNHGFVGDIFTVNGTAYPVLNVKRRKYRFRFLDASVSRIYELKLMSSTQGPKSSASLGYKDDELEGQYRIPDAQQCMKFTQIASYGGLLPFAIKRDSFELWPAKRREFIVDFTRYQDLTPTTKGDVIYLTNVMKMPNGRMWANSSRFAPDPKYKVPVLKFVIGDDAPDNSVMPSPLKPLRALPPLPSDWQSMLDNRKIFEVERGSGGGEIEWLIKEHRTVMRNGKVVTAIGSDPGHPDDASREDLVALDPGESTILYRGFRDFHGPYVAHCHNLAHEDHAMMFGWEIT